MSCSGGLGSQRGLNNGTNFRFWNAGDAARAWSIFLKADHSQCEESLSPQLHGWSRDIQSLRDILIGHAISGHGDHLCALDDPQRKTLRVSPRGQRGPLRGRQKYRWSEVHDAYDSFRRG